jgi:hypothetical protein
MKGKDEAYMHEINRLEGERDFWKARAEQARAAMLAMRDLWPAERWATLSAICRDHPVIEEEFCKHGTCPSR